MRSALTTVAAPSTELRTLLRDSASILRIRFHEPGATDAADAARTEFVSFLRGSLELFDPDAPLLLSDAPPDHPKRSWVLNPIDGADAFRSGFPCFAVVLGLRERRRVVAGYVYNPVTEDLFWSDESTDGAYCRDRRIRVRRHGDPRFGLNNGCDEHCSHGLSLCSVAAGRCDYAVVRNCDWVTEAVSGYIVARAGGRSVARGDRLEATAGRLRARRLRLSPSR